MVDFEECYKILGTWTLIPNCVPENLRRNFGDLIPILTEAQAAWLTNLLSSFPRVPGPFPVAQRLTMSKADVHQLHLSKLSKEEREANVQPMIPLLQVPFSPFIFFKTIFARIAPAEKRAVRRAGGNDGDEHVAVYNSLSREEKDAWLAFWADVKAQNKQMIKEGHYHEALSARQLRARR